MRLRIVSLFALICATAFTVTGCNQSIVGTTSGTPGGNGASYVFATNFNATTQQGTVESFPINHIGTSNAAVPPASTTVYPGEVSTVGITSAGFGYTVAPTIVIAPPTTLPINGGVQATAVATLNNAAGGSISSITITNPGSGYTASPAVTVLVAGSIAPPAGANGAVLTATAVTTPFLPLSDRRRWHAARHHLRERQHHRHPASYGRHRRRQNVLRHLSVFQPRYQSSGLLPV